MAWRRRCIGGNCCRYIVAGIEHAICQLGEGTRGGGSREKMRLSRRASYRNQASRRSRRIVFYGGRIGRGLCARARPPFGPGKGSVASWSKRQRSALEIN